MRLVLRLALTERRNLPRLRGIADLLEAVSRRGQRFETEELDRRRRTGQLEIATAIVEGRQPRGLTARQLLERELPIEWRAQEAAVGIQ